MRQVLDNLLGNVRAHTPPGTTAVVLIARDGGDAVCRVSDDGPGIDRDTAIRLFERFYRSDASRSRASGARAWVSPSSRRSWLRTEVPYPPVPGMAAGASSSSECRHPSRVCHSREAPRHPSLSRPIPPCPERRRAPIPTWPRPRL